MLADWWHPALRLAHYAILLGLFGATAFRISGLRHVPAVPDSRHGTFLIGLALAAPIVSTALVLAAIAAMMGQRVLDLEIATVEMILRQTDMGLAFLARMFLLVFGLAALAWIKPAPLRLAIASACYGLALVTLAWSGHAAATEGSLGLAHRLNDSVHLLASGLWIGAIGWFTALIVAAKRNKDQSQADPLLQAMHSFAPIGVALVVTVIVTGVINAQLVFGVTSSMIVVQTPYGMLLAAKVAAVMLMLICAARNAVLVRQQKQTNQSRGGSMTQQLSALRICLAIEFLLAVAVVSLVAHIGLASPTG